jgi:hypothetical protein
MICLFVFGFYLFKRSFFPGFVGGITAQGTAVEKHFILAGKAAGRTADGSEKTAAVGAGFYFVIYLVTAIIAKKTRKLFQFYAVFAALSPLLFAALLLAAGQPESLEPLPAGQPAHGDAPLSGVLADFDAALPDLSALPLSVT